MTPAERRVLTAAIAWGNSCEEDDGVAEIDLELAEAVEELPSEPGPTLKLFYWDSLTTLEEHWPGQAFALAASREEAIARIMADADPHDDALRVELEATEPQVFDAPVGFTIWGTA